MLEGFNQYSMSHVIIRIIKDDITRRFNASAKRTKILLKAYLSNFVSNKLILATELIF